jgi:hypothetical protein
MPVFATATQFASATSPISAASVMRRMLLGIGLSVSVATAAGCGAEGTTEVGQSTEDIVLANWDMQSDAFGCGIQVVNNLKKSSRRQTYAFTADNAQQTTFTLSGSWPASYGARIIVTDASGTELAKTVISDSSWGQLTVSFPSDGDYVVAVSPSMPSKVKKKWEYKLSADCSPIFCASGYNSNNDAYYAKNFGSKKDGQKWLNSFGGAYDTVVSEGPCNGLSACTLIYNPVCGAIGSGELQDYGNRCMFEGAIRASAGGTVGSESKGYANAGQCTSCDYSDPNRSYVAQSPEKCMLVKYFCAEGTQSFSDECGCGCEPTPALCHTEDPDYNYVVNSPEMCMVAKFACPEGAEHFADDCGCGCYTPPTSTCHEGDPAYSYLGNSAIECAAMTWICAPGFEQFFEECGCGCKAL